MPKRKASVLKVAEQSVKQTELLDEREEKRIKVKQVKQVKQRLLSFYFASKKSSYEHESTFQPFILHSLKQSIEEIEKELAVEKEKVKELTEKKNYKCYLHDNDESVCSIYECRGKRTQADCYEEKGCSYII